MQKYFLLWILLFSSCKSEVAVKQNILNKEYSTPFDYRTGTSTIIFYDSTFFYKTNSPFIMTSKGTWSFTDRQRKQVMLKTNPDFIRNFLEKHSSKTLDSGIVDLTNEIVELKSNKRIYLRGLNFYRN